MRITIAERIRPFSHEPGTYFVLPGSSIRVQIFPALIRIHDLSESTPQLLDEIKINVVGPVKDFTVEHNLEKGHIHVWGHTTTGYMRYRLKATNKCINVIIEKTPTTGLHFSPSKYLIFSDASQLNQPNKMEHLSLGIHKAQDWTLLHRRCDMGEIFPIWMRLGQCVTAHETTSQLSPSLLQSFDNKKEIIPAFRSLYLAGFDLGLSPRLHDDSLGISLPILNQALSPLQLLTLGSREIRRLFIQQIDNKIAILPFLPPEFHCGRMLHISCGTTGTCDIEWSKHNLRRMIFTASETGTILFCFQNSIHRFRMREHDHNLGTILTCGNPIDVIQGKTYYFDNFT